MGTIEVIGIALGSIATILTGVWFIIYKAFGLGKTIQKINDLPCKSHEDKINTLAKESAKVDERTGNMPCYAHQTRIDRISEDLVKITSVLMLKDKDINDVLSAKHSPRRLTDAGQRIFTDANGQAYLDANKDYLFAEIDRRKPLAKLDVEDASYAVLIDATRLEAFNPIKTFIYNAPNYQLTKSDGTPMSYDVSLIDMCFVMSIPLRDMYLAEHPEITA